MNDIIKTIEKNKSLIIIALAVLMFIFFAVSAVDVAGKAQAGGFKVLFDGSGLGFSRFLSGIILIIPVLIVVNAFFKIDLTGKLKENFNAICFVTGFISCVLMIIALPDYISLAWGAWLYMLLAAAGTAVSCIERIKK